jgi:tRNA A-37 threonylcarbamoyl transferase component Bud32
MNNQLESRIFDAMELDGFDANSLQINSIWIDKRQLSSVEKLRVSDQNKTTTLYVKTYPKQDFIFFSGDPSVEANLLANRDNYSIGDTLPRMVLQNIDSDTLIVEGVKGRALSDALNRKALPILGLFNDDLLESMERSSKWLTVFHTESGVSHEKYDWKSTLEWIERRLDWLSEKDNQLLSNQQIEGFRSTVITMNRDLMKSWAYVSLVHGDYAPHNILINTPNKHGIVVMDFATATRAPIALDITKLISYLELLSPRLECSSLTFKSLKKVFIEHYGLIDKVSELEMDYCIAMYKIGQLNSLLDGETGFNQRRQVKQMVRSLEKLSNKYALSNGEFKSV